MENQEEKNPIKRGPYKLNDELIQLVSREDMANLIASFNDNWKRFLRLRCGLDGDAKTVTEIAEIMGVNFSRIVAMQRQILTRYHRESREIRLRNRLKSIININK
jgi:DNA-directed RNA polymerase sigma subunit (sigma70/sigma32)